MFIQKQLGARLHYPLINWLLCTVTGTCGDGFNRLNPANLLSAVKRKLWLVACTDIGDGFNRLNLQIGCKARIVTCGLHRDGFNRPNPQQSGSAPLPVRSQERPTARLSRKQTKQIKQTKQTKQTVKVSTVAPKFKSQKHCKTAKHHNFWSRPGWSRSWWSVWSINSNMVYKCPVLFFLLRKSKVIMNRQPKVGRKSPGGARYRAPYGANRLFSCFRCLSLFVFLST